MHATPWVSQDRGCRISTPCWASVTCGAAARQMAIAQFDQAEDAADARGWDEPYLRWWRAEHVEALLEVGRIDEASALVDAWETMAEPLGRGRVLAHALRCRGLIAASRGALSSAVELLERAAMQHAEVGDPFGRARALLALGAVRRRVRQKRTARAALDGALAEFVALGATSWAATARAELARIGGRERISGLSPSEQRIALCVAEGLTNREIASALFLGERTVAGHLTRIYSKLGVRSRTELALRLHPSVAGIECKTRQNRDVLTFPHVLWPAIVSGMPKYLVETFLARGAAGERQARERRASSAAEALTREGTRVGFGGSIHVPDGRDLLLRIRGAVRPRGRARRPDGRPRAAPRCGGALLDRHRTLISRCSSAGRDRSGSEDSS